MATVVTTRESGVAEASLTSNADVVVEEAPVAVVYNGLTHAVMMLTPVELDHFALGFSLTEGIIDSVSDVFGIDQVTQENGLELKLEINSRQFNRLKQRRRMLKGVSGCGLCGKESLDLISPHRTRLAVSSMPRSEVIATSLKHFTDAQLMNQQCGSVHGCGFFDNSGALIHVSEDVGRHNALDKLIGYLIKHNINLNQGFVLASSRASFEMVQKCQLLGIATLVTVSAATSMAVALAQSSNMNLIGFARDERNVVYHQASM
ncbi:formate dehydrogenase accessory sulfurtransferase FdhD [Thalassotalea litorea]|uniref:formate dehydrogenase accessory sulfurtransferase FdhD n=1 Tax=Thalassotalea litorea TaxID=2020715 RepID=UPI0014850E9C|nr:formate dehydrogenase accessory sulfurtransferase FdhD [Thalassotalea litorea]